MQYNKQILFSYLYLLCLPFPVKIQCLVIDTEIGKTFDILCPAKHHISRLAITRQVVSNHTDFRFSAQCQPLPISVGEEKCTVLLPIPLLYYDLSFDDYEYNCDCNEYLVGIRSEHFGTSWGGAVKGPERRIQLICCKSTNIVLDRCGYTGMESLLKSPWRECVLGPGRIDGHAKRAVIQGIVLNGNYINSRVCSVQTSGTVKENGQCDAYEGCNKNSNGNRACYNRENEPFGWEESMTYLEGASLATYRRNQLYQKQESMCRSGQRVISLGISSRNAEGDQEADSVITVKCSKNSVFPCYCYWMNNCPKKGLNEWYGNVDGAWYVGGIRTWWDSGKKQRKIEVLCCRTNSLKLSKCSSTSISKNGQWSEKEPDGDEAVFIRGIESSYTGDGLTVEINSCTSAVTYDWCTDDYDIQCRRCKRGKGKGKRRLPEANGNARDSAHGSSNSQSTSSSSTHSHSGFFFTPRGSSGWGPLWFDRPMYHSSSNSNQNTDGTSTDKEGHSESHSSTGNEGRHSAPPACDFKPKCSGTCPLSVSLPDHGHVTGSGVSPPDHGHVIGSGVSPPEHGHVTGSGVSPPEHGHVTGSGVTPPEHGHVTGSGVTPPEHGHVIGSGVSPPEHGHVVESGTETITGSSVQSAGRSLTAGNSKSSISTSTSDETRNSVSQNQGSIAEKTEGSRSIVNHHEGAGRGGNPVGPSVQESTGQSGRWNGLTGNVVNQGAENLGSHAANAGSQSISAGSHSISAGVPSISAGTQAISAGSQAISGASHAAHGISAVGGLISKKK